MVAAVAKVAGSYPSVVRGVSEQVPQDRRPGQHFEQVNMISDPVRGNARRHGSRVLDELVVEDYDDTVWAAWLLDTAQHKTSSFFVDGQEYDLIYRTVEDNFSAGDTPFAFCINKETGLFIPVELGAGPVIDQLSAGGVSAVVNVGKYVFVAGHNIVPSYTATDKWGATSNLRKMAVWFRGGDYGRNFSVTITKTDNTKLTKSYKTKSASYQGTLDTSDILASDPEYQKKVNDRVNEFNGLVTNWIGEAAEDQTPENIATQLQLLFAAEGVTCSTYNGALVFDDANYKEVSADDHGDGTLAFAVGAEITTLDDVSGVHYPGKIVKVRPKKNNGTDALYLQAIARDGQSTSWTEVRWKEVAGYEMEPVSPFCIGTVKDGTFYLGGTPTELTGLTGDPTPEFKKNEVGDDITSPMPFFFGRKISYLSLFQDRLIIGSGATLFASRPGDYFNWFRQSVLSVEDDDPHEMYAQGSEDDTIESSCIYDKNLFLFGRRFQYTVNGRVPIKPGPGGTVIVIQSSHEEATDAAPINSGNYVFYSKTRNNVTSVHQVQVGQLEDSPESFEISQQLDEYIQGKPVEIVAVTSPNTILIRTDANRQVLYTYAYLDTPNGAERLFDSWSRWTWSANVGHIIGVSRKRSDILVYVLRHGIDKNGDHKIWVAAEKFVLDSKLSDYPYVDSLRPTEDVLTGTDNSYINPMTEFDDDLRVAFGKDAGELFLLGTDMEHIDTFIEQYPTAPVESWTGIPYEAYFTPTNPYMRDKDGKAITTGNLTLGNVIVSIADSSGMEIWVKDKNANRRVKNFIGRIVGDSTNLVGRAPVVTTSIRATVGREVRSCTYTISAKTWLPMTVTAIEWTGQYFNNTVRV